MLGAIRRRVTRNELIGTKRIKQPSGSATKSAYCWWLLLYSPNIIHDSVRTHRVLVEALRHRNRTELEHGRPVEKGIKERKKKKKELNEQESGLVRRFVNEKDPLQDSLFRTRIFHVEFFFISFAVRGLYRSCGGPRRAAEGEYPLGLVWRQCPPRWFIFFFPAIVGRLWRLSLSLSSYRSLRA